ncbi:UNVERIFIED_ORG: hypothetical protein EOZ59_2425 [Serratia quinivorans]|jgi:hypothetical protein
MTPLCYEIVTYQVKDSQVADTARDIAQRELKRFPGYIDWIAFSGMDVPCERVDLVVWRSHEEAQVAAKAVASLPEFLSFRSSVSHLDSMGHYVAPRVQTSVVRKGYGIEIGRFRLKPGVNESAMHAAYNAMIERHLAHQTGWKNQYLVSLGNGVFIDMAFADDQLCAEAICASWQGETVCEVFLAMIDPMSMEFGSLC